MDIPITLLSLVESFIISVIAGASTLAVISYALCLRHGYPKDEVGQILIKSIYTIIRLFHIFFAILVAVYITVFGIMDGLYEVQVEYGIKGLILFINALIAYGMTRKFLSIDYFSPVIAAGWYFLAGYHAFTLHIVSVDFINPLFWYATLIIAVSLLFVILRSSAEQYRERR